MSVDAMTEKGASWSVRSGRMVGGLLAKTALGLLVLIAAIPLGIVLLVSYVAPLIAEWADKHDRH